MSDCGVCIGGYDGELTEFFSEEWPKARKAHKCSECARLIAPGQKYQRCSGKSDGDFWSFITCSVCAEIRRVFTCDGSEALGGMLWEDMAEYGFRSDKDRVQGKHRLSSGSSP